MNRDLQFINDQAAHEGWAIFETQAGLELQREDDPDEGEPTFEADQHAWHEVILEALGGSDLHQAAILYLKGSERGHSEWLRLNAYARQHDLIGPYQDIL